MSKRPKLVKIVDPLKLWNPSKTPDIPVADNIVRCGDQDMFCEECMKWVNGAVVRLRVYK